MEAIIMIEKNLSFPVRKTDFRWQSVLVFGRKFYIYTRRTWTWQSYKTAAVLGIAQDYSTSDDVVSLLD